MRLAKYLAYAGVCSRKEATRRITSGRVTIDGRLANHTDTTTQVGRSEWVQTTAAEPKICCDGIEVLAEKQRCYWLFNKPIGIDCRLLPERSDSLHHCVQHLPRVFPVGRLDKDSRGLLLLTNDGDLCHRLMHPTFAHEKTYRVTVADKIDADFIAQMGQGVSYKDVTTRPCEVNLITEHQFEIVLTQGLNRQIRRMSHALGQHVIDLQRIAIGQCRLKEEHPEGEFRHVSVADLPTLFSQKPTK